MSVAFLLDLFMKFALPVLVRSGVGLAFAALAGHGIAIGSTVEQVSGIAIAVATWIYGIWRGSPNNLLKRAAQHPDPEVRAIVQQAQDVAVGNSPPSV